MPTDTEFRRRVAEREAIEGKEIPDNAVLNMKSNFVLPEVEESFFKEVWYTEQSPEESHKVINGYNEEARSAGLTILQGVRSFKNRNEAKRREQNLKLPGKHVKFDKTMKPVEVAKTSVEKVQASTSSISSQEVKLEPTCAGPSRVEDLKRENKKVSSPRSNSRDKSSRTDSKDRRRSRSRDRKRTPIRDRSQTDRSKRSRSSDKKIDARDRGRKRSRSRSRDRSSQKYKDDIKPWSRNPTASGTSLGPPLTPAGRSGDGFGPSRGSGSFSSSDRPPYKRESLNKDKPDSRDSSLGSYQDTSHTRDGSFRGRGRGWGRGTFEGARGRGLPRARSGAQFSELQEQRGNDWAAADGPGAWMDEPYSRSDNRSSQENLVPTGSKRPFVALLGDPPKDRPNQYNRPQGSGWSGRDRDARPGHDDHQGGNNEFFNDRSNFANENRRQTAEIKARAGFNDSFEENRLDDRSASSQHRRVTVNDYQDRGFSNSSAGPSNYGNNDRVGRVSGSQYNDAGNYDNYMHEEESGSLNNSDIKIRDLDDEFASRMEKRLETCEDEPQQGWQQQDRGANSRDTWRSSNNDSYNKDDDRFGPRNQYQDRENWDTQGRFGSSEQDRHYGSDSGNSRGHVNKFDNNFNPHSRRGGAVDSRADSRHGGFDTRDDNRGQEGGPGNSGSRVGPGNRGLGGGQGSRGFGGGTSDRSSGGGLLDRGPYRSPPSQTYSKELLPDLKQSALGFGNHDVARNPQYSGPPGRPLGGPSTFMAEDIPGPSNRLGSGTMYDSQPPKIPNWDTNALHEKMGMRDSRFPVTSDGKDVGSGYSVQYHGEVFNRPAGDVQSRGKFIEPEYLNQTPPVFNARSAGDRINFQDSDNRLQREQTQ